MSEETRYCTDCQQLLTLNHFYTKYYHICKACHSKKNAESYKKRRRDGIDRADNIEKDPEYYIFRKKALERKWKLHGIDMNYETFIAMLEQQNHKCAICGVEQGAQGVQRTRGLVVDHNHETGEVRGLLCHRCNLAIGLLGDDEEILTNALTYIRDYN